MKTLRKVIFTLLTLLVFPIMSWCTSVDAFAHAIARAEGFYTPGTIPARMHNPGDIKAHGAYIRYHTDQEGFAALRAQVQRMIEGRGLYGPSITLSQVGRRYASTGRWALTVAKVLGISPSATLREIFGIDAGLAPEYTPAWEKI